MTHPASVPFSENATWFQRRGWPPLPGCWPNSDGGCGCGRGHTGQSIGKAALVRWSQHLAGPLAEETLARWKARHPRANTLILLRPAGISVVDCDSPDAIEEARDLGLPPGPAVATGRGRQYLFRAPCGVRGRVTKRGASRAIDLFTDGYIVAPGSMHRLVVPYRWLVSPSDGRLPDPPGWVVDMLRAVPTTEAARLTLPSVSPSVELERLNIPAGLKELIQRGWIPGRYPSRSEAMFSALQGLVRAGCDNPTIAGIFRDPRYLIGEKARERSQVWLAGEIARARAKGQPRPPATPKRPEAIVVFVR